MDDPEELPAEYFTGHDEIGPQAAVVNDVPEHVPWPGSCVRLVQDIRKLRRIYQSVS